MPETVSNPMPDAVNGTPVAGNPRFKLFRHNNPATALGMAVNHMMTKPAFAQLRFGEWSRILVGQINRKHYCFVVDERNQIQGFLGWAITTKDKAEAWVEGRGSIGANEASEGDCIIFNAWSTNANTPGVNRVLLDAARQVMKGNDMMYWKRHYKDGSTRPVRMRVNDFVERHLARKDSDTAD
jgi:hemolysin-activating ACP:hemolysin acyltransferase